MEVGVLVLNVLSWGTQIEENLGLVHRRSFRIFKTFQSREPDVIAPLFNSFVRYHLERCYPPWSPRNKIVNIKLESPEKTTNKKIKVIAERNYWDCLNI